jgi:hypothetical protein
VGGYQQQIRFRSDLQVTLNGNIRAFKHRFVRSLISEFTFNQNRKSFLPEQLDIYWENLVLALIGETIDEGDEICGCRVVDKSAKKGKPDFVFSTYHTTPSYLCYFIVPIQLLGVQRTMFKLELWLRSANPETAEKMRVRMLDALSDGEASKENNRLKMPEFDFKKRN